MSHYPPLPRAEGVWLDVDRFQYVYYIHGREAGRAIAGLPDAAYMYWEQRIFTAWFFGQL